MEESRLKLVTVSYRNATILLWLQIFTTTNWTLILLSVSLTTSSATLWMNLSKCYFHDGTPYSKIINEMPLGKHCMLPFSVSRSSTLEILSDALAFSSASQ